MNKNLAIIRLSVSCLWLVVLIVAGCGKNKNAGRAAFQNDLNEAKAYYLKGEWSKASEAAGKAIDVLDAELNAHLARNAGGKLTGVAKGDWLKMEGKIRDDISNAHLVLGQSLWKMETERPFNPLPAREQLQMALDVLGDRKTLTTAQVENARGFILYDLGQFEEARSRYQAALYASGGELTEAQYNVAVSYQKEAEVVFKKELNAGRVKDLAEKGVQAYQLYIATVKKGPLVTKAEAAVEHLEKVKSAAATAESKGNKTPDSVKAMNQLYELFQPGDDPGAGGAERK
jgi:tetratricopeptide (TPR) repeat protein